MIRRVRREGICVGLREAVFNLTTNGRVETRINSKGKVVFYGKEGLPSEARQGEGRACPAKPVRAKQGPGFLLN